MKKLMPERIIDGVEHVLMAISHEEEGSLDSKVLFSRKPLKEYPIWGMEFELENCYWIPWSRIVKEVSSFDQDASKLAGLVDGMVKVKTPPRVCKVCS